MQQTKQHKKCKQLPRNKKHYRLSTDYSSMNVVRFINLTCIGGTSGCRRNLMRRMNSFRYSEVWEKS